MVQSCLTLGGGVCARCQVPAPRIQHSQMIHHSHPELPFARRDQTDASHSPSTAAAEGEDLAAKPGAVLNQRNCSVLFQLPSLALPSPPSTWQGSCTALSRAGGAGPCVSVPSSSHSSSPPSSLCPAPATTNTTGKVGQCLLLHLDRALQARGSVVPQRCSELPTATWGFCFFTPPVAILVPPARS